MTEKKIELTEEQLENLSKIFEKASFLSKDLNHRIHDVISSFIDEKGPDIPISALLIYSCIKYMLTTCRAVFLTEEDETKRKFMFDKFKTMLIRQIEGVENEKTA